MTIFLAIILSALILIECTFVMFIWDLDYRMAFNSALRAEVETILAEYDRQLFDTYGIYAVTLNDVDDEVFQKAISTHGYTGDSDIEVYGVKALSVEDLRAAITVYYANRAGGIWFEKAFVQLQGVMDYTGIGDILETLRQFTSSEAAGYLEDLLSGASTIAGWFDDASELDENIASEDYRQEMIDFAKFKKSVDMADNDLEDLDIGIDLTDMSSLLDGADKLMDVQYGLTDALMTVGFHPACAYYAANNFDCVLSNDSDCSINGTMFSDIHEGNMLDAEYIMCGMDGRVGVAEARASGNSYGDLGNDIGSSTGYLGRNSLYRSRDTYDSNDPHQERCRERLCSDRCPQGRDLRLDQDGRNGTCLRGIQGFPLPFDVPDF